MKTESKKIEDIEALRAVAVLLTIGQHIGILLFWGNDVVHRVDMYFGLWSGVDLFFAISGFVIARSLLPSLRSATTREGFWRPVIAFWIRRVYRIWPTSYLWMLVILAGSAVLGAANYFQPFRQELGDFASVAVQIYNVHLYSCVSNNAMNQCGSAGPWWSLALEEQFYMVFPLIVLLSGRRLPYVMGAFVLAQIFLPRPPWSVMWAVRTDAIALGVLLAIFSETRLYLIAEPTFLRGRVASIAFFLLMLFLLLALPPTDRGKINIVPFGTGLVAVASVILVFAASYNKGYIVSNGIAKRIAVWAGSRSYGLYLIHYVSIFLTRSIWHVISARGTVIGPNYTLRYLATWIFITIALAEINYRFVETPLRIRGRRIADRFSQPFTSSPVASDVMRKPADGAPSEHLTSSST